MWDEALTRLVARELGEIDALLARSAALLAAPADDHPSFERLAALAQVLTSFYTGLERVFQRVAGRCDEALPSGDRWHVELLLQVAQPTANRPAMISEATRHMLREYLAFRHRSHHAYTHRLEWPGMSPLVARVPEV